MLSRREFVTAVPLLPVILLRAGPTRAEEPSPHGETYRVDVRMLFGLFNFHLEGSIDARIHRTAGQYQVVAAGQGSQISNRLESAGVIPEQTVHAHRDPFLSEPSGSRKPHSHHL